MNSKFCTKESFQNAPLFFKSLGGTIARNLNRKKSGRRSTGKKLRNLRAHFSCFQAVIQKQNAPGN